MNRHVYEAAKKVAEERGLTLAGLVEAALAAAGVPVTSHAQQTPMQVRARPARKAERVAARRNDTKPASPSIERQMLGDGVANALGFK